MRARALINITALQHNFKRVQALAPGCQIMAVVKANAYGHGVEHVVPALVDADYFGVATLEEALRVQPLTEKPVVLMAGFTDQAELDAVIAHGFQCFIHDKSQLQLLQTARLNKPLIVWPKFNTGMNRLGFPVSDYQKIHRILADMPNIKTHADVTHLACADDIDSTRVQAQLQAFSGCQQTAPLVSIANSAALLHYPKTRNGIVRAGLMLYGASPVADQSAAELGLTPVMTLQARVMALHALKPGDAVGYSAAWQARQPTKIANVSIGYGDGYPQRAQDAPVLLHDHYTHVVGRVSMDSLTIDVTPIPNVQVGDMVTLWGEGLPVEQVATASGRICYELLTNVSARVPRVAQSSNPHT